ncbi:MAG: hypothetical protein OXE58_12915 [Acidobacteria bacterium]|nr:hypothetical protein [Acidobacteriota bacterium]
MKIDMMESLGYSFLRHAKRCWIVQTNWKWPRAVFNSADKETRNCLKRRFEKMKEDFGDDVFKGTRDVEQLLKQAELDALGMTRNGEVHALETAFHEGGLSYGKEADTIPTVRKKMLRTYLVLKGLRYSVENRWHVWFISPKVKDKHTKELETLFCELKETYCEVDWHLCINESVKTEVWKRTLEKTEKTSDTSELLLRAKTLLKVVER